MKCAAADPEVRAKKGKLSPEQRARRAEQARRLSADPAVVAKRTAAMAVTVADPEQRQRHAQACREAKAEKMKDPAFRAMLVDFGHRFGKPNLVPSTPGQREKAAMTKRRQMLSWCPEEFWELNRQLKHKGFMLEERKAIILAEVEGTPEHARRMIANYQFASELRNARDLAQRY